MKTYGQFCPVAKASEIFAERWTPLIIRELLMGSRKFSELEIGMAHIPRSLLTQLLKTPGLSYERLRGTASELNTI